MYNHPLCAMKARRQALILELIDRDALHSQEQLRRRLRQRGFDATQATISRDIADLGLVKRAGDGAYQRPGADTSNPETALTTLERAAAEFLSRVERVEQLVVVRTGRGQAQAAGRGARPRAAARGRRHDRRRRHDSHHRARRASGGGARQAPRTVRGQVDASIMERIVLAYSGGLDTSVAIPWLAEKYGAEIVDRHDRSRAGQGARGGARPRAGRRRRPRPRARRPRGVRARLRPPGAQGRCVTRIGIRWARRSAGRSSRGSSSRSPRSSRRTPSPTAAPARRPIAGVSTSRPPRRRARALNPAITVLAPAREWGMTRLEEIEYARARGIPVPATVDSPYSIDANLWGRSIDCGALEDPWTEPPEEIYTLTKPAAECPDEAAYVEMTFERGVPTAINGVVDAARRAHRQPRHDRRRPRRRPHRQVETVCRIARVYEAPAAVVLHTAHTELQRMVTHQRRGSLFEAREPPLRRHRVQRPVVHAAA